MAASTSSPFATASSFHVLLERGTVTPVGVLFTSTQGAGHFNPLVPFIEAARGSATRCSSPGRPGSVPSSIGPATRSTSAPTPQRRTSGPSGSASRRSHPRRRSARRARDFRALRRGRDPPRPAGGDRGLSARPDPARPERVRLGGRGRPGRDPARAGRDRPRRRRGGRASDRRRDRLGTAGSVGLEADPTGERIRRSPT